MEPFQKVTGVAAPLLAANIDTDVIMPKQFLKGIDRNGLAKGVFFDQRFLPSGQPNPEFILNKPAWKNAKFLVVGPNFGCGSSREHAVWGLKQLGIKAIIGTSFAGIFFDNCLSNGLLTVQLDGAQMARITEAITRKETNELIIDLPSQTISIFDGDPINFEIGPLSKKRLIEGLDAIGMTLKRVDEIKAFEKNHAARSPWLFNS